MQRLPTRTTHLSRPEGHGDLRDRLGTGARSEARLDRHAHLRSLDVPVSGMPLRLVIACSALVAVHAVVWILRHLQPLSWDISSIVTFGFVLLAVAVNTYLIAVLGFSLLTAQVLAAWRALMARCTPLGHSQLSVTASTQGG
jgi:hypothetical protein